MISLVLNFLKSYRVWFVAGAAVVSLLGSGYIGYKLCDARWLVKQSRVETQYRVEQKKLLERLSVAEKKAVEKKQKREIVYREKKIYITKDVPDCPPLAPDKLHELQCLTTPSKCKR